MLPGLLGAALTLAGARAADTNAVLDGWLTSQTNLQTWTSDLTQTRTFKTAGRLPPTPGHVWFATPNRFRWELGKPAQTIALGLADQMFLIYPPLKRAERYALDESAPGEMRELLSLLDAGFPRNRAELDARFRVLSLSETNGAWQLTLQPKSASARRMIPEIRVGLATNDFSLTSTEIIGADGFRMRNDFTNAAVNSGFDEAVFHWKPDPEFKVTEPFAK
jgi:outer membrane lipoprotein-sorting protein